MNISTLRNESYAAVDALMGIKEHTQKAIDRANATLLLIDVHGFFEANQAVSQLKVQIDAEIGFDDCGQVYTSFSLGKIEIDVEPDVDQSDIYGFDDIYYSESGQIKFHEFHEVDRLDHPLANGALVAAMVKKIFDYEGNYVWFTTYLPNSVGDPKGRGAIFTVDRAQVNAVGDVLLSRLTDDSGRQKYTTKQQIFDAQDAVIDWVEYLS